MRMKGLSARSVTSVLVVVCAIAVAAGTLWLGMREMSVETAYNVVISAIVILISGVCVAALLLIGRKKRKK